MISLTPGRGKRAPSRVAAGEGCRLAESDTWSAHPFPELFPFPKPCVRAALFRHDPGLGGPGGFTAPRVCARAALRRGHTAHSAGAERPPAAAGGHGTRHPAGLRASGTRPEESPEESPGASPPCAAEEAAASPSPRFRSTVRFCGFAIKRGSRENGKLSRKDASTAPSAPALTAECRLRGRAARLGPCGL